MQKSRSPANAKGRRRAAAKAYATLYGYARVSTGGKSVDAQVRELRAAGAATVFREVASGAKTDRPQLRRLLSEIAAGDVLMVTRLDRLARSTRNLLNTLAAITEKKSKPGSGRLATHVRTPLQRTGG
jgi:predicted site-specific integrase-resolvase